MCVFKTGRVTLDVEVRSKSVNNDEQYWFPKGGSEPLILTDVRSAVIYGVSSIHRQKYYERRSGTQC